MNNWVIDIRLNSLYYLKKVMDRVVKNLVIYLHISDVAMFLSSFRYSSVRYCTVPNSTVQLQLRYCTVPVPVGLYGTVRYRYVYLYGTCW